MDSLETQDPQENLVSMEWTVAREPRETMEIQGKRAPQEPLESQAPQGPQGEGVTSELREKKGNKE